MAHVKDVYTFLHDANARNDAKLKQFRVRFGPDAYAFYFMVLEMLREEPAYKLNKAYVDGYAYDLGFTVDRFNELSAAAITLGLLCDDGVNLYSPAFDRRMEVFDSKRKLLKANALSKCKANAKQMLSKSKASEYIEQEQEQEQEDGGSAEGGSLDLGKMPFQGPDRSCQPRKPHPKFNMLWFSDRELKACEQHFQKRGLRPEFYDNAFRAVETWFSDGIQGQKAYKVSVNHSKRVLAFGIDCALKQQRESDLAAKANGQNSSFKGQSNNYGLHVPVGIGGLKQ